MGKLTVLLALLGLGVFSMRQTGSTSRTLFGVQSSTSDDLADVVARGSALAGFVRAEQALSGSFEDVALSGSFEGGTYTTTASVADGAATVTSVGVVNRLFARPDSFLIRALVMPLGDPEELPDFLSYGMLVGGDLRISGSSEIVRTAVTGDAAATYNPLVHANGSLTIGSGATRAKGFGTYSGALLGKGSSETFQPVHNPDGLPPLQKADPVPLPPFDAEAITDSYGITKDYSARAGEYWAAELHGSTMERGILAGGPRDAPAVYRVRGNLHLVNVIVDGYAVFVVDGRTDVSGYVRGINQDSSFPHESQIAIYTGGELTMGGGSEVHAQIVAQGGMSFRGNVDIYGSLATHSDFSNGGGATVHVRPASPALSRPWQEGTAGIGVLAYTENAIGINQKG